MKRIQDDCPQHLTENERAALETFVARLRRHYGDDLLRVVLFGSKARGDFDDESDLDLLVVVRFPDEDYWEHWQRIADIAWEVEFKHSVVTTTIVWSLSVYSRMQRDRSLLYRNIEKDGIELWMTQLDAPIWCSIRLW
jgi:predicted nucleotidyltransferase